MLKKTKQNESTILIVDIWKMYSNPNKRWLLIHVCVCRWKGSGKKCVYKGGVDVDSNGKCNKAKEKLYMIYF